MKVCTINAHACAVKRIDIMDTLAPDLAQTRSAHASTSSEEKSKRDDEARAQQAELEQLAERVSAARCVY